MTPADAFRSLRKAWFDHHLRANAPEREWEDDDTERDRHHRNAELQTRYDEDTERILQGEERPIAPRCTADLTQPESSRAPTLES